MQNQNMLITSAPSFEGHTIAKYVGYHSGISTKFVFTSVSFTSSSALAKFDDIFGQARGEALAKLISSLQSQGANAIIGLTIDFESASGILMGSETNNMVVAIASGTGVVLQDPTATNNDATALAKNEIFVTNYDLQNQLRATNILLQQYADYASGTIFFQNYADIPPKYAQLSITLYTIFEEALSLPSLSLQIVPTNIENRYSATFDATPYLDKLQIISHAKVHMHKVHDGNSFYEHPGVQSFNISATDAKLFKQNYGFDAVCEPITGEHEWLCCCGTQNESAACTLCGRLTINVGNFDIQSFIEKAETLGSAKEIEAYFSELELSSTVTEQIQAVLDECVVSERRYGNQKTDTIKRLKSLQF